ncbi:MAG: rod shape-determining protein MreC [Bacillota bacterium]|nr:rod shape-determining protein MreC [Bacillota bacterium]
MARRRSRLTIVLVAIVVSVTLFIWSLIPGSALSRLLSPISFILEPAQNAVMSLRQRFDEMRLSIKVGSEIQQLNAELREENARLRQQVQRLEEENREFNQLRDAISIKTTFKEMNVLHANILSDSFGTWFDVLRVDRGRRDGLTLGEMDSAAVVDVDMNLIGRTISADEVSAKVLPLVAEGATLAGRINRMDGVTVRVHGDALLKDRGLCMVDRIPPRADIAVGDEILTSGDGGLFPPGIPVGVITALHDDEIGIWAELEPYTQLDTLTDVFILLVDEASGDEQDDAAD